MLIHECFSVNYRNMMHARKFSSVRFAGSADISSIVSSIHAFLYSINEKAFLAADR